MKREIRNLSSYSEKELLEIIENAGITGEGGAQFPAHIKYDVKDKRIKNLILNGAECEPYLTCDYTLMKEYTRELFDGIKIICEILKPENIILAIDEKYSALESEFQKYNTDNVKILTVSDIYPQGSEQLLINSILNKEIPKSEEEDMLYNRWDDNQFKSIVSSLMTFSRNSAKNEYEIFVVDRNSGKPIKDATVKIHSIVRKKDDKKINL